MRWLSHVCLSFAALLAAYPAHSTVQQAFLVQNSGWMEPFYTDPDSQFKPLIAAVIQAAADPSDTIHILSFSQSNALGRSPSVLFSGSANRPPVEYLKALGVAKKGTTGALADTDFKEAISATITEQFSQRPGIIWLFTNNKNSPNNDQQTSERNREFYALIHTEPAISRSLAFPLKMPVKGKLYSASGMMVYALAYGEEASKALVALVDAGRLAKVFTNQPARLKPVDQDAVRLVPKAVKNASNISVSLAPDKRTLLVDIDASEKLPVIEITAEFQNLFYPYVIENGSAKATLAGPWGTDIVDIQPASVSKVLPSEAREVTAKIPVPVAQIPSSWSPRALAAMGSRYEIPSMLEITLSEQRLSVSKPFTDSLAELFPGDPISEIFTPPSTVKSSVAKLPIVVRVQFPLAPLVLAVGGALLLLGGVVAALAMGTRAGKFELKVDGMTRKVAIKPFSPFDVRDMNGNVIGTVKRSLGKPRVLSVLDGHTISVR